MSTGRRLTPDARRQQLIDTTRALLNERADASISTADVAAAAGVTRALVHHYFGGIDELRQAVALDIARNAGSILSTGPGGPVADRVRANVNAFLDAVEANGEAWFATLGTDADTNPTAAGQALRQAILRRIIDNNAGVIHDTPWTRLCLTGYMSFSGAVCRQWIRGQNTRAEAEHALIQTLLHLLLDTIPNGP